MLMDSFWRAAMYCLHPRVIALSFMPLLLMAGLALTLGYFFWDAALDAVRNALDSYAVVTSLWNWLESMGAGKLKTVVAPLVVIFAVTPVLVLLCLLVVAVMMTPALTALVVERRFPHLERKQGGSFLLSVLWSVSSTVLALVAMVVSLPLWLVPPLILILPPLIWGWLTYRVMAFDVLANHASKEERRQLFRGHRGSLLGIGLITGYLGAAPSLVWASGAMFAAAFAILVPVAIWLYTLVFAFSSLWFGHFALAALEKMRQDTKQAAEVQPGPVDVVALSLDKLPLPDDPGPKQLPQR
jgi:hypothetical protein